MDFIAIDFETANSQRSSICSLGVAVVEKGRLVGTDHFLVKPTPNYYDPFNSMLHGIDDSKTRNEKPFDQQWSALQAFFDQKTIVAHNAAFDCSVLRAALNTASLTYPDFDYHCTYRLAKETLPLYNHKLDSVSRHFNIELDHHHAESDAKAAALIALRLCDQYRVGSLEELSTQLGFKVGKIISKTNSYKPFSNRRSK